MGKNTVSEPFSIQMLGGFAISRGGRLLSHSTGRTKQIWALIQFLLFHINTDVSQEKLIEVLWPKDDINNPQNALKNLVYRARLLLNECFGQEFSFIVSKGNTYSWNKDLPQSLDVKELETAHALASGKNSLEAEQRIEHYLKAISLYKGDFLPNSAAETWVIPLTAYFC
ncbi:MAG: transcriptional regulator, partial [Clostridiales bacterium]|nr:transcriptional regulator [Clostridiales bacterium]